MRTPGLHFILSIGTYFSPHVQRFLELKMVKDQWDLREGLDSFHNKAIHFMLGTSKFDGFLPLKGMVMQQSTNLQDYSLLHTNASSWHNTHLKYSVIKSCSIRQVQKQKH